MNCIVKQHIQKALKLYLKNSNTHLYNLLNKSYSCNVVIKALSFSCFFHSQDSTWEENWIVEGPTLTWPGKVHLNTSQQEALASALCHLIGGENLTFL